MAHLGDVAEHIHASYWLICPDDAALGGDSEETDALRVKEHAMLASAPIVYQSADGAVRLYDVRRLSSGADEKTRNATLHRRE